MAFDIETIPDTETGRRLYDLEGLSDKDVAEVMFTHRREKTGNEFLPAHLQRIIAISVAFRHQDEFRVWSLGDTESGEDELVQRFFDGVGRYTPNLVSWNGGGFDLPVLHYRALRHGVACPRYWDTGDDDREFKWNNYLSRFHSRHTDLMDVLAGYQARAFGSLDEVSGLLGFPGKMGMDGSKVWGAWQDGRIAEIRNYCETDVLNTYLVYLRWALIRGNLTDSGYQAECERVRAFLHESNREHLQAFEQAWIAP
jgi:hypothetical protein